MSKEKMTSAEMLANEPALLKGLMQAGTDVANAANAVIIDVARNGVPLFLFEMRPMTEEEFVECRETATGPGKIIKGIRVPGKFDQKAFRSMAIHRATLPPKGSTTKIWDHQEVWQQRNVLSGWDLIDKVLLAGEKERIYAKLEFISGYAGEEEGGTQLALEETVGE